MCWRVALGQDHPSPPSLTGRQSTEEEPLCPRVNPLPRHCDLELQIPGGGASRVTQTDSSSLEPIGTLEHCPGRWGWKRVEGGVRESWLGLPFSLVALASDCASLLYHGARARPCPLCTVGLLRLRQPGQLRGPHSSPPTFLSSLTESLSPGISVKCCLSLLLAHALSCPCPQAWCRHLLSPHTTSLRACLSVSSSFRNTWKEGQTLPT